jgi:hypothetical protein
MYTPLAHIGVVLFKQCERKAVRAFDTELVVSNTLMSSIGIYRASFGGNKVFDHFLLNGTVLPQKLHEKYGLKS